MKPKKSKQPDPPNFNPVGFVFARAGLEIRIADLMALQDDQAVLVRDQYEQMMVYRTKPDEALRFATQLAGLVSRALERTVGACGVLPWSQPLDRSFRLRGQAAAEPAPPAVRPGRRGGRRTREK